MQSLHYLKTDILTVCLRLQCDWESYLQITCTWTYSKLNGSHYENTTSQKLNLLLSWLNHSFFPDLLRQLSEFGGRTNGAKLMILLILSVGSLYLDSCFRMCLSLK